MTAERQRAIRECEAKGDYQQAANLRVKAALRETPAEQTPQPSATFPADRALSVGLELVKLSNNIQRDLSRAQTLLAELTGVARALERKR